MPATRHRLARRQHTVHASSNNLTCIPSAQAAVRVRLAANNRPLQQVQGSNTLASTHFFSPYESHFHHDCQGNPAPDAWPCQPRSVTATPPLTTTSPARSKDAPNRSANPTVIETETETRTETVTGKEGIVLQGRPAAKLAVRMARPPRCPPPGVIARETRMVREVVRMMMMCPHSGQSRLAMSAAEVVHLRRSTRPRCSTANGCRCPTLRSARRIAKRPSSAETTSLLAI